MKIPPVFLFQHTFIFFQTPRKARSYAVLLLYNFYNFLYNVEGELYCVRR